MTRVLPYDLTKTAQTAGILLLIYCLCEVAFAWHSFQLLGFYDAVEAGQATQRQIELQANRLDELGMLIGGVFLLALIGCYIAGGMWIYRAASNAQTISPDANAITPGWAVGWYFVPFANFVLPYKAMRQTWHGLAGDDRWDWPAWGIVWWMFWIATTTIGGVGTNINLSAETIDQFRTGTILDVVSSITAIPAALLFRKLILEMTAMSATAQPTSAPDLEEGYP